MDPNAGITERLDALEARVAAAEQAADQALDELAALRLVAAYAPLVDSARADEVAALWTEDGSYDVDTGAMVGRDAIAAMVRSDAHQQLVARGCGHVPGLPHVRLHSGGLRATVIGHTQLLVRTRDERYAVARVTANRWELERSEEWPGGDPVRGWRVASRVARLVTDSGDGRALLGGIEAPLVTPVEAER